MNLIIRLFLLVVVGILSTAPMALCSPTPTITENKKDTGATLTIEQTITGNIFYEQEVKSFNIQTNADSIVWSYADYRNQGSAGRSAVVANKVKLTLNPAKPGWYKLVIKSRKNGNTLLTQETSFAIVSNFDLSAVQESPFMVQTHAWQSTDTLIPIAKRLGVKNVRDVIRWEWVELAKNVYTFGAKQDSFVAQLTRNNLKPYLTLALYNQLYDSGNAPVSPEARLAFAQYCKQVLTRYPAIQQVEIWNEPDIGTFSKGLTTEAEKANFYFNLLKASYELLHPLFPQVKITGFVVSDVASNAFLDSIYKQGAVNYMDEYSFHYYNTVPENIGNEITRHRTIMQSWNNNQTIPLNLSETGYTTASTSEKDQANYLPRRIVNALANGISKASIYNLQNKNTLNDSEGSYGLIRHPADSKGAYVPKPAFVAYAVLTRQLTGAQFVQKEPLSPGSIYSFVFTKGVDTIRCMYATSSAQVKFQTSANVTVTDIMGTKTTLVPVNGEVYLNLDKDIVYVQGTGVQPPVVVTPLTTAVSITR